MILIVFVAILIILAIALNYLILSLSLSHMYYILGQRPNDLNKPPEVEKQRPVYENTFSTDRYDGSSYQSPTLPSTGTGGAGKIQPRQHPFTAAIPAKPAVETRSNRSGEIGQYHQQPVRPCIVCTCG